MAENSEKGLGSCLLGLFLWKFYSFLGTCGANEYGTHIVASLGFTLMVFGPVLFWIVLPLKDRWYDKGKRKRFQAVMAPISVAFLICLGVSFLPPGVLKPSVPREVPEVSEVLKAPMINSVTTEAVDHSGTTTMKVTVEGEKDNFSLILNGPENNTVGEDHITSLEMSDGRETAWLSMASVHTQAKSGTYTMVIKNIMGDKVYESKFTYSGPELKIEWGSPKITYHAWTGYRLSSLSVTISNSGDLPAYATGIKVSIAGKEETSFFAGVIRAGEVATLEEFYMNLCNLEEGTYRATCELKTRLVGQGSVTLATHSTIVQIPVE